MSDIAASGSLLSRIQAVPKAQDPARFEHFNKDIATASPALAEILQPPPARALLSGVVAGSPFLAREMIKEADFVAYLLQHPPETVLSSVLQSLPAIAEAPSAQLATGLRQAKRRAMITIALADLADIWSVKQVTQGLSDLADAAMQTALTHLLREAGGRGEFTFEDEESPQPGCGIFVLGMGKLGAGELNFSSDIDVIVLFDRERAPYNGRHDVQRACIRLTQNLVRLLQEQTADGYVFRTDLRLRPDPGVTPVAISTQAAEQYYESMGQNWERAAMIKARVIAGDQDAGNGFLAELRPFIWRRNLDYAAIADVHSIKRQIHAHQGHGEIAVAGHNIKLGRGGIRDIEFFTQTQQLIAGGRDPRLRQRGTIAALQALEQAGWLQAAVVEDLRQCYEFHRRLEHRIQMVEDQQTHSLPVDEDALQRFAGFCGFSSREDLSRAMRHYLGLVQKHYSALFEASPTLSAAFGNMVFTGSEDDPGTVDTLAQMGFKEPVKISGLVRGWHHGRYRATKSARARELLTQLVPAILQQLSETANPDTTAMRFDGFVAALPAGVQLFSMLKARPHLLTMLIGIMGSAPRMAQYLSQNVNVLESVLTQDFLSPLPARPAIIEELKDLFDAAQDFQDVLDAARRFAKDRQFQLGMQILRGEGDVTTSGPAYADLADAMLTALLPPVMKEFSRRHGLIAQGELAILAMGKLGGRELTADSDLDLILLYDTDGDDLSSDGDRPLPAPLYFGRLSQRFVNALTTLTPEGLLYEIDTRLRPSGNSGPLVSHIRGFEQYQRQDAWLWEHMALTRARLVHGSQAIAQTLETVFREVLAAKRDPGATAKAVNDTRLRVEKEKATDNIWHVKQVRGGLLDIEFISQFLQLAHAHEAPEILAANTGQALQQCGAFGVIDRQAAESLYHAWQLYSALARISAVAIEDDFIPDKAPVALANILLRAVDLPDVKQLQNLLIETQSHVQGLYRQIILDPISDLAAG